ncbi:MAG: N-acetylmannosaminyltransferase [Candidatus Cloacimonetes bacterium HGW-Cloacimonetes-1]|jgi:N-acetylglucosaminyldiphosphoundecaprenol N-acetyl-beta-D-mannosaminyltransferase|nr:MAG: N-acetylmannosaminyltransferase [Candidatus Cloacimonetes bacterium HGW-Cloacimonetes-1]
MNMSDKYSVKTGSFISELFTRFIDLILSILLTVFVSLPVLICFTLRKILLGTSVFTSVEVLDRRTEPVKYLLFNSRNWLVSHSLLFPKVITGRLKMVGVSLHHVTGEELNALDRFVVSHTAGIFSLFFVRSGTRIAFVGQSELDLEYLNSRSIGKHIKILVKAIPAILLYSPTVNDSDHFNLFGVTLLNISMKDAVELIDLKITNKIKTSAFFVNADCLNKIFVDTEYYQILRESKVIFPDGIGINIALRMTGGALKENVNGTDMLPYLCEKCVAKKYRIFLLGAAPGVAEDMKTHLVGKYPELNICGVQDGYFDWESESTTVIDIINNARADLLLVAFGAPLQEKFINRFIESLNAPVLMGVGGLFDFYSGRIPRAPYWMREIGCEWVFRLIMEPKRMWKRYIIGNPLFLYRVSRWKKSQPR